MKYLLLMLGVEYRYRKCLFLLAFFKATGLLGIRVRNFGVRLINWSMTKCVNLRMEKDNE